MIRKKTIVAGVTLAIASCCALHAFGQTVAPSPPPSGDNGSAAASEESGGYFGDPDWFASGRVGGYGAADIVRFGWWGFSNDGSLVKVGEFADLKSTPFWDVDTLRSDGTRTLDFSASGFDREGTGVEGYFYRPGLSVDIDYERFLRRWDHKPLVLSPTQVVGDDLNVGADYAIRVQKLDATFKGCLTNNIKWKLNLWGMRKSGERQENSTAHCYEDSVCHLQSQQQRIDWVTLEIEPVIEARFGPVVAEYSRTMRGFSQDDQIIQRDFDHFGTFQSSPGLYDYAIVPDHFTQIDRLKLSVDVTENTKVYTNMFRGDTEDKFRDTNRAFYGVDARVTNRSFDGLTLTAYGKWWNEETENVPFLLPDQGEPIVDTPLPTINPAGFLEPVDFIGGNRFSDIRHPVERRITRAGVKGVWRPFRRRATSYGFSLAGGYEYSQLHRRYVTYGIGDSDRGARDLAFDNFFTLPQTRSHEFYVGPSMKWSRELDTSIRYKMRITDDPLLGLTEYDENYPTSTEFFANTNQPEHIDLVELRGTWMPSPCFLLSAMVGIENRHTSSPYANFDEDNYPIVVSAWYAPTSRWSLSAGYAYFTDFVDQDITIGIREEGATASGRDVGAFRTPFAYTGRSQLVNVGTRYDLNRRLSLRGDVQWLRGTNGFAPPEVYATDDWSQLPSFSEVIVETTRLSAGVDYLLNRRVSCYFRYVYFDYNDKTAEYNSGTSNGFLAGVSASL